MELKITEEKENPMFNRKEILFKMESKFTPSRAEIGKSISENLSAPIDAIEIKKISGRFGSNNFDINAFVYETKEDRMSTEKKPKLIEEKPVESQETQAEKPDEKKEAGKIEETTEGEKNTSDAKDDDKDISKNEEENKEESKV